MLFFISGCLLFGCSREESSYPELNIQIESLKSTVKYLSAIKPSRNADNPDSLKMSADYISGKFREYGLKTDSQKFAVSGIQYENVIASVGPENGQRLVIGAHYDVCGDQPGADDNASGIAGLLEIARFAKAYESRLRHRIDFVAYTLEEPPHFATTSMGSYVHAKSLKDKKVNVRGMICLESIGYFSDKAGSQSFPVSAMKLIYPTTGNFIAIVGNIKSLSLSSGVEKNMAPTGIGIQRINVPAFIPGIDFSDHRNYWKFGYRAIMVTDTALYRNSNYHEPSDTPDTLDYTKMRDVVKGVCRAILNMK